MTSQLWQLARNLFLKYSSSLLQTSQKPNSAKKTRQHDVDMFMSPNSATKTCQCDVDKFMSPNSAKKTCQCDIDKFMKLDKLSKFTETVGKVACSCRNSTGNDRCNLL